MNEPKNALMEIYSLRKELLDHKNPKLAENAKRFFKTGPGEYSEGDEFYGGIGTKLMRSLSKKYENLNFDELNELINSKIHEERQIALFILVNKSKSKKTNEEKKKQITEFYLKNSKQVNNWDLVDISAHYILGNWIYSHQSEKKILYSLAKSNNLWEKRIAIISTLYFIRQNDFSDTLKIAKMLLNDKHDLIHKAVGWMLREVGKRNQKEEEDFLISHYKKMPRTMLRYAIEKFEEEKRQKYLSGNA